MQKKRTFSVEMITVTAMLIACQVVLGNLLQVPMLGKQYHFGFVPIALAGALMGPIPAAIVGGLGDLIGAHLFPAGTYFPGFTLTNVLVGLVCGFILHGKKPCWWRCIAAVAVSLAGINLFLNSFWLHMLAYVPSRGYWTWVTVRAPNYLIEVPVNTVLCYLMLQAMKRVKLPASMQMRD
nr:folate family ECF transporter S component [Clostridia bacterium]